MLEAAFWGLIQGLTEFLPISSSGHLVLVPALFGREGPDLATSALLHVGTLLAVLVYFRHDLVEVLRFTDLGKRLLRFMLIGTIPAALVGLTLRDQFDRLNEEPRLVAIALIATGIAMVFTKMLARGQRRSEDVRTRDAVVMGLGQAVALIPGVSRSGATISTAMVEGFERREGASLAFLLGIPAIAGAGLLNFVDLASEEGAGVSAEIIVGVVVAAIVGYVAIAGLLNLIRRTGLAPYGWYCIGFGLLALVVV